MKIYVFIFTLFLAVFARAQSYSVLTVSGDSLTIINDSATSYYVPSCPAISVANNNDSDQIGFLGLYQSVPPHGSVTISIGGDGHMCEAVPIGTPVIFSILGTPVGMWTVNGTDNHYNFAYTIHVSGDTCSIVTAPVYTNYTFTVVNTLSTPGVATWVYNGSIVKSVLLQVGESASWTTPSLKVSPAPSDNFTESNTLVPSTVQVGQGDGGQYFFTNGNSGGSSTSSGTAGGSVTNTSGGGTVTSGGGNTTVTYTNQPIVPPTNTIVWQSPSGSASESTLQAGFSQIHNDLGQVVAGESVINSSIQQTMIFTNFLGQIGVYSRSNNDASWQLLHAITNLSNAGSTNNISLTLTNYAQETTQQGISNLLASVLASTNSGDLIITNISDTFDTNFSAYIVTNTDLDGATLVYEGYTNYADALAASTAAAASSGLGAMEAKFDELIAGITDFSSVLLDYYPSMPMVFDMSAYMPSPHAPSISVDGFNNTSQTVIDFDPMHTPWLAELFALMHKGLIWLIAFWYLQKITEDAWKVVFVITGNSNINAAAVRASIKKNT